MIIASTPASITITSTPARIIQANGRRVSLALVNVGANALSLGLGSLASANTGITLSANGGSYLIDRNNPFFGEIWAISSAGSTLSVQETSVG